MDVTFPVVFCDYDDERLDLLFQVECVSVPCVGDFVWSCGKTVAYVVKRVSHVIVEEDGRLTQTVNVHLKRKGKSHAPNPPESSP